MEKTIVEEIKVGEKKGERRQVNYMNNIIWVLQ
jgi:hypothetical protein